MEMELCLNCPLQNVCLAFIGILRRSPQQCIMFNIKPYGKGFVFSETIKLTEPKLNMSNQAYI